MGQPLPGLLFPGNRKTPVRLGGLVCLPGQQPIPLPQEDCSGARQVQEGQHCWDQCRLTEGVGRFVEDESRICCAFGECCSAALTWGGHSQLPARNPFLSTCGKQGIHPNLKIHQLCFQDVPGSSSDPLFQTQRHRAPCRSQTYVV